MPVFKVVKSYTVFEECPVVAPDAIAATDKIFNTNATGYKVRVISSEIEKVIPIKNSDYFKEHNNVLVTARPGDAMSYDFKGIVSKVTDDKIVVVDSNDVAWDCDCDQLSLIND